MWLTQFPRLPIVGTWGQAATSQPIIVKSNKSSSYYTIEMNCVRGSLIVDAFIVGLEVLGPCGGYWRVVTF